MKKKALVIGILVVLAGVVTACDDKYFSSGCKNIGETYCVVGEADTVDILYICNENFEWENVEECNLGCSMNHMKCNECNPNDDDNNSKCEEDESGKSKFYKCIENGTWEVQTSCAYSCSTDHRRCERPETCINGWQDNGACKQIGDCERHDEATGGCVCVNGNSADGSCKCPNTCKRGCEADGTCIKAKGCQQYEANTGDCVCISNNSDGINDNHNADGTCICPSTCIKGCEIDGSCKQVEGCSLHDNTGACICKNGNEDDGSCKDICVVRDLFNPKDGSCSCKDCQIGCFDNGLCKVIGNCTENGDCREYAYCKGDVCYCKKNRCLLNDANNNHMYDDVEGEVNNRECWNDNDCVGAAATGEKFCDNAMGYKCSVRCSKDSDCVDGFICRSDGRCVSKYFTTIWDSSIRMQENFSFYVGNCKDIKVCWDWNEYSDCEWVTYKNCASKSLTHDYKSKGGDKTNVIIKIEIGYEGDDGYVKGELDDVNFFKSGCFKNGGPENNDVRRYTIDEEQCCKLLEVQSFGLVGISSVQLRNSDRKHGAFENCYMLGKISNIDIPDPKKLTSMVGMFMSTCSFDSLIDYWDVSNVTSMEKTFWMTYCSNRDAGEEINQTCTKNGITYTGSCLGISKFNKPLNHWDVSKVEDMSNMFGSLSSFNQPLNNWNVSSVTDMTGMFGGAYNFNQPLDNWNVSKVNKMQDMFYVTSNFDQDLSSWTPANQVVVKNMFNSSGISKRNYCKAYNAWKSRINKSMTPIFGAALEIASINECK